MGFHEDYEDFASQPSAPRCGIAASRGYGVEADRDELWRAAACRQEFRERMARHALTPAENAARSRLIVRRIIVPLVVASAIACAFMVGFAVGLFS